MCPYDTLFYFDYIQRIIVETMVSIVSNIYILYIQFEERNGLLNAINHDTCGH